MPKKLKMFLYRLTSLRSGEKDGKMVIGGTHYHHNQLLMIIEAEDVEQAARALNVTIRSSFDRSCVKMPTVYYTSDYYAGVERPQNDSEGYFYLSLKEVERGDREEFRNFAEKYRVRVVAPKFPPRPKPKKRSTKRKK